MIPDAKLKQFYASVMKQPKIARDFILLLLFTGLRRNEAAKLKWTDIDFESRTLTIEADHNKSNRMHTLPLTPIITAILQSRLPAESEFVFPEGHINEPRAVLAHLREEMGWQWLLHDLRRTNLSAGEKAGVPFLALQKIANHVVKREVTDKYLFLDVEYVRLHMETISQRLLELMGTSVEDWRAGDRFNVEAALAGGLGHPVSRNEMTVDEVPSGKKSAINIRIGAKNDLDQFAKLGQGFPLLTGVSILEEDAEELYW